jgi:hypothetical protein
MIFLYGPEIIPVYVGNSFYFLFVWNWGSRMGSTWPQGHTSCWQVYTNDTRVMLFIPTKSVAWMSTSWLLGNVYTAVMQGQKARSWDFKIGTSRLRETTLTENIGPPEKPGVGRGADNPTLEKKLVTKSEEAITGYFSWQKLLRKARAHVGLSSQLWLNCT